MASPERVVCGVALYLLGLAGVLAAVYWLPWGLVGPVASGSAALAAGLFVTAYHFRTRGHWRDTETGVHMLTFSATCAAIMLYVTMRLLGFVPVVLQAYGSAVIYVTVASLFVWRLRVFLRVQRRPRDEDVDDAEDYRNGYPPRA